MILEFIKKVRKNIHLPDKIEIGSECFQIRDAGEVNQIKIVFGAWETTYLIDNPEEFAKKPVEQLMLILGDVYKEMHDYIDSKYGDDQGTL